MGFIQDVLDSALLELATVWAAVFDMLGTTAFYIEEGLQNVVTAGVIDAIYTFTSAFAVSLVLLKVLKKGFWTYVLWKDGDPDAPVQHTVLGMVLAVVAVTAFPTLYGWFTQVCLWLINRLTSIVFGAAADATAPDSVLDAVSVFMNLGVVHSIAAILYFIMLLVLYLHFLKRSVELMLLRVGFPLACLGLLDSDNGVFASTVKTFIQVALTTVCQLLCMTTSVVLFTRPDGNIKNLLYCIACNFAAFTTPRLLQYILMQTSGGGSAIQRASSTLHTISLVKSLVGK